MEIASSLMEGVSLAVTEQSQVAEARRVATSMAGRIGFDETERGAVAILVTEAAKNIVLHARTGELIVRALLCQGTPGLELIALDRGPGMIDVGRCLTDGYSTAGTPGTGMGALRRLSSAFDVHSLPGIGTAVLARVWAQDRRLGNPIPTRPCGALSLPMPGEEVCGDAWAWTERDGRTLVAVIDGLGHGPDAAAASRAAVQVVREHAAIAPAEILQLAHGALRSTRGAAMAVAEVDAARGVIRFAGVGNISATVVAGGESRSLMSHNGTVGHQVRRFQELEYPWPAGALLIMHSDGLATQWRLDQYPGILGRDPDLIAGVLYRDHKRGRDDVTVLVLRRAEPPQ